MDAMEAPKGYQAVLKSSIVNHGKNLCSFCDWRKECQKPDTDFSIHNHRCMDYPVTSTTTGMEVKRNDGCSVLFKRI